MDDFYILFGCALHLILQFIFILTSFETVKWTKFTECEKLAQ